VLELVAPVLVTALGGLTFLAYRHPKAYAPIGITLAAVLMVSGLALMAWVSGSEMTFSIIKQFIPLESQENARAAREALASAPDQTGFVFMCIGIYLLFLTQLRSMINIFGS
jgi:uncharacterized membrane protein